MASRSSLLVSKCGAAIDSNTTERSGAINNLVAHNSGMQF